ncbi:SAM-dependent methyltransferase [Sulfuriflexus mobilis]|uniref:spermine/spermidine synthase domain-containing protein n=1 Tax=Sulfuriflexus mobilis TaxID=1811807 RepID=UPI000F83F9C7|nr:SAM-dependent methyltransferase [Sulfuriflexus mobilis]
MTTTAQHAQPPWCSIAVISMTALAYEILLMRVFSIIQWHHFAYMIISLALLGYGASGTFLTLFRNRLLPRYERVYLGNIVLFGLSAYACYLAAQYIPFNAEEILWDPRQAARLVGIYVLLALPFFFAANAIGLSFIRYRGDMSRIYAADLIGAGFGSLVIIILLFAVLPGEIPAYIMALAMLAAALASWELYRNSPGIFRPLLAIFLAGIIVPFFLPGSWTEPEISPYKGLPQALRVSGATVVKQRSSPLGLVTVVENPVVPFRQAPGLSLNAHAEPPEQVGVFIDADAMTAITRDSGERQALAYLGQLTSSLPYHLSNMDDVLVLGAGGGAEVLQARYHGVTHISAVELNRQIIDLLRDNYRDFSGQLYDDMTIKVFAEEARGFVAGDEAYYDLVQLAMVDSFSASSAGLYALSESYLYTVEALQTYLARLKPDGYLGISRWIKLPPRDTLRLFATAIDALRRDGIKNPEQHLVLIRSLQTSTLLIKKMPFTANELTMLRAFCRQRSFDVAYYPGMTAGEANRYNVLAKAWFHIGATAMLGEGREDFMQAYKFNLEPATDDRPYFFQFFKWAVLPEIWSLTGQGGMPLLEWGYLILVATLLQALLASIVLVLLPLVFYHRGVGPPAGTALRLRAFTYFLALGLAFLFIEIAYIQKFILFLHHPIFAVTVVLAAFLVFAGLGSAWSGRFAATGRHARGVGWSVAMIVAMAVAYLFLLGPLFSLFIAQPTMIKVIVSVLLIAPLAFCMGMPFPLGLSRLAETGPGLVPWVWGVNGCASVLSAVLASLLAIHFGFTFVILAALALYGLAAISAQRWLR